MSQSITLLAYLTKANPSLQLHSTRNDSPQSYRPSHTKHDDYPLPSNLKRWNEFKLSTVKKLFGSKISTVLDEEFENLRDFSYVHPESCKIFDEDSFKVLVAKSNQCIVLEALTQTPKDINHQSVSMMTGGAAKVFNKPRKKPDWAGKSATEEEFNILPGDAKISRNWVSSDLPKRLAVKGSPAVSTEILWPIRQVLHYCVESQARYGYIISDKELVVLRVGLKESQNTATGLSELRHSINDESLVEWASIPWEHDDGCKGLTVNLALWVLHLLAANNGRLDWNYKKLRDEELMNSGGRRKLVHSFSTNEPESQQPECRNSTRGTSIEPQDVIEDIPMMSFYSQEPRISASPPPLSPRQLRKHQKRKVSTTGARSAKKQRQNADDI